MTDWKLETFLDKLKDVLKLRIKEEKKKLLEQFHEDLITCRGMDYLEIVNYIVDLEDKYEKIYNE